MVRWRVVGWVERGGCREVYRVYVRVFDVYLYGIGYYFFLVFGIDERVVSY